jgi:hypothetical protein
MIHNRDSRNDSQNQGNAHDGDEWMNFKLGNHHNHQNNSYDEDKDQW